MLSASSMSDDMQPCLLEARAVSRLNPHLLMPVEGSRAAVQHSIEVWSLCCWQAFRTHSCHGAILQTRLLHAPLRRDAVSAWDAAGRDGGDGFGLLADAPVTRVGAALGPRAHVLVCAPSNSALDEVVSRLLQHGLLDWCACCRPLLLRHPPVQDMPPGIAWPFLDHGRESQLSLVICVGPKRGPHHQVASRRN